MWIAGSGISWYDVLIIISSNYCWTWRFAHFVEFKRSIITLQESCALPFIQATPCSGHTSATTWNSAKSEGTASDECAWCVSRNSKCLDQKWRGKRFFGQIGQGGDNDQLALITSLVGSSNGKRSKPGVPLQPQLVLSALIGDVANKLHALLV